MSSEGSSIAVQDLRPSLHRGRSAEDASQRNDVDRHGVWISLKDPSVCTSKWNSFEYSALADNLHRPAPECEHRELIFARHDASTLDAKEIAHRHSSADCLLTGEQRGQQTVPQVGLL